MTTMVGEIFGVLSEAVDVIRELTVALKTASDCLEDAIRVKPSNSEYDIKAAVTLAEAAIKSEEAFLLGANDFLKKVLTATELEAQEKPKLWTVYLKESALGNPPQRKSYESYIEASARAYFEQLAEVLSKGNWRGHIILTRPDGQTECSEYLPRIENVPCGGPKQ